LVSKGKQAHLCGTFISQICASRLFNVQSQRETNPELELSSAVNWRNAEHLSHPARTPPRSPLERFSFLPRLRAQGSLRVFEAVVFSTPRSNSKGYNNDSWQMVVVLCYRRRPCAVSCDRSATASKQYPAERCHQWLFRTVWGLLQLVASPVSIAVYRKYPVSTARRKLITTNSSPKSSTALRGVRCDRSARGNGNAIRTNAVKCKRYSWSHRYPPPSWTSPDGQ